MIGKNKKWLAYSLYGILLTIALLYYHFPSAAVEAYLQARARHVNPRFILSVGKISPTITIGLKFLKPALALEASPRMTLFNAESLSIRPVLWSFVRAKRRYCFDSKAYHGALEGCIDLSKNNSTAPIDSTITVKGVRIADDSPFKSMIGRNLVGDIDGTITFSGPRNLPMKGNGEANLRMSNGSMELLQPILSLEAIDFNEVLIRMVLRNQKINVTNIDLKARNVQGTLSGTVNLEKDLFKSSLDLKGTLEPTGDFLKSLTGSTDAMRLFRRQLKRGKINFSIDGTLEEPRFRFI